MGDEEIGVRTFEDEGERVVVRFKFLRKADELLKELQLMRLIGGLSITAVTTRPSCAMCRSL
jgi:hypothetical protein